jgi:hypothetical protein
MMVAIILYLDLHLPMESVQFLSIAIIQHSLKSGGIKDHCRQVKVPGTACIETPVKWQ